MLTQPSVSSEMDVKFELVECEIPSVDSMNASAIMLGQSNEDKHEIKSENVTNSDQIEDSKKQSLNQHGKNSFCCIVCNKLYNSKIQLLAHNSLHCKSGSILYTDNNTDKIETEAHILYSERDNKNANINDPLEQSAAVVTLNDSSEENKVSGRGADTTVFKSLLQKRKYYTCNVCNEKIGSKSSLASHMKLHSEVFHTKIKKSVPCAFKCYHCPKEFKFQFLLANHLKEHSRGQQYKCTPCNRSYLRQSDLTKHNLKFHKAASKEKMLELLEKKINKPSVSITNSSLIEKSGLVPTAVGDTVGNSYNSQSVKPYSQFQYQCEHCPKKFSLQSLLAAHMLKHSTNSPPTTHMHEMAENEGNKPVTDVEDNSVKESNLISDFNVTPRKHMENSDNSSSLLRVSNQEKSRSKIGTHHAKLITGRNYICHLCEKKFKQKSTLLRHLHCVHERKKDYSCAFCQKNFFEKSSRDNHERIHTGEKPYECDLCDKSFRTRSLLSSHMRFHKKIDRQYRFHCKHCPKKFYFQSALNTHLTTHTGDRRYKCTHCPKGFYRRLDLARHIVQHHPQATSCLEVEEIDTLGNENVPLSKNCVKLRVEMIDECSNSHPFSSVTTNALVTKYTCEECGKIFFERRTLDMHTRTHTRERPHTCQTCGQQFRQISSLQRHLRTVHEGRRDYPCHECGKLFGEKAACDDHLRVHTGERPYSCGLCKKNFKSRTALNIHKKCHSNVLPHECVVCGKCFHFAGLLVAHMKTHTGKAKDKPHNCEACDKCFPTMSELKSHARIHLEELPLTCEQCGKQFRFSGSLHRHVKIIHEGRKDFPCHLCGRKFGEKASRDGHIRIHTGERPFSCNTCGKDFKTKAAVYIHKKYHNKSYVVSCPTCQKPFLTQSSLNVHLRSHTGEKPHSCDVCGRGFTTNRDMLNHRVLHSDDKPFECAVCGRGYRLKRYLTKHILTSQCQ